MAIWKRTRRAALYVFLTVLGIFFCTPVLFLLTGSVTSRYELGQYLAPLSDAAKGFVYWKWMPDYPAFSHYENVLLFTPQFYVVFWNSVKITAFILAGQLLVAVPAAWAFAIYPFPRRRLLFTVYLVLMLMPFQVTMLSSYLVLNGLHLMNTHGAVILPAVFSAFPVFLIYRSFCGIPKELLEAARVDGATKWQSFRFVTLPLLKDTIVLTTLLRTIWEFNSVDLIFSLTNGGPVGKTTTLSVLIANQALTTNNYGYGSAISVVSFFILAIVAVVYMKASGFGKGSDS